MNTKRTLILFVLIMMAIVFTSCGSKEPAPVEGGDQVGDEGASAEESQPQVEQNTTGTEFQEQVLPDDFPEAFPLPEYTKVGSTTDLPGGDSYRIFFAFPEVALDEVLIYYNQELQANGWSVDAEGPDTHGYGMWVTHPEYETKLVFIEDEYGVVLDLSIAPLGELEEIPDSGETYGESESLGDSGGDIPSDFPVPGKFTAIDLPAKLADEGYQLAFSFPDLAELAIVEFSTALMGGGWGIGEFQVGATGGYYMMPFTDPNGFEGYALITSSPDVAGLPSVSGAVIALHPGTIE